MARQWISNRAEYEKLFDGVGDEKVLGEVSPVYLQATSAPGAIREVCPEARLVAILRDPVDRAYAHFMGRRRDGLEERTDFGTVVTRELSEPLPDDVAFGSYLGCGRYYHFLKGYYDLFPRERIKIFLFDNFRRDSRGLMAELYGFLGVDGSFKTAMSYRHNQTGVIENRALRFLWTGTAPIRTWMRPYWPEFVRDSVHPLRAVKLARPELDPTLRARLVDLFREDVLQLEELIGQDLSAWRGDSADSADSD